MKLNMNNVPAKFQSDLRIFYCATGLKVGNIDGYIFEDIFGIYSCTLKQITCFFVILNQNCTN